MLRPPVLPGSRLGPLGLGPVLALGVAAAAGLGGCAHDDEAPPGPEVVELGFEGNRAVKSGILRQRIVTEKTGFWPFSEEKTFDPVAWDHDRQRLERVFRSLGYHQAQVLPRITRQSEEEIELAVSIVEGPRTQVEHLEITGLEGLEPADSAAILRKLPLAVGAPFVEQTWAETKAAVLARLQDQGYAQAEVQGQVLVDVAASRAAATLLVTPGPRFRVGDIALVQGRPPHLPERFIREQVRLAFPGDPYFSPRRLSEAQRRVFGLGVFSTVEVSPTLPPDVGGNGDSAVEEGRLPLLVRTQVAPFRTLRLGGGGGFDQVRNEVRLIAGWSHKNFFGGLRKLNLDARVGWAFLPGISALLSNTGTPVRQGPILDLSAAFEQPRFLGRPTLRLLTHAQGERELEEAFSAWSVRLGPDLLHQFRSDVLVSAGYEIDLARLEAEGRVDPRVAPIALGCSESPCFVPLSYLRQRAIWDRRDNPLEPTRGFYLGLELQEGGGPLGGSFTYFKALADARLLGSVGRFTLGGRIQLGAIYPSGGRPEASPISQRFFAGGATSMRGFASRRLAPLVAIAEGEGSSVEVAVPIGGNSLLGSNLELRFRTSARLALAAFWDTGYVGREAPRPDDIGRLFHALGFGLRFSTPVGPIRLDLGFRLPVGGPRTVLSGIGTNQVEIRTEPESQSCFGFGSSGATPLRDGVCSLHLSIGEAF